MKDFRLGQSIDINDIARFECMATTGIGYAYSYYVEFKNLLPDSPDDSPRWESDWRRSKELGSVSVWLTDYLYLKDVQGIEKGAKVRFYLDVIGSKKYCIGTEEFIYVPNSRYQATYDGRGTTLKPYMNYKGRSIFREPICNDETIAYDRPVESILAAVADHVYVKMGNTYFGCHGGYNEGDVMYTGYGDLEYAVQTAGAQTEQIYGEFVNDGCAGIIYGITGVCHQIANRILWTSQIIVDKAAGYWLSSLIYGPYGRGKWNPINVDNFKNAFTKSIYKLYQLRINGQISAKELVLQTAILDIESHCGKDFVNAHPGLLDVIVQAQTKMFNLGGEDAYEMNSFVANQINDIAIELQSAIANILSDEEYFNLLGITKDKVVQII